jgi:hypothetical protein
MEVSVLLAILPFVLAGFVAQMIDGTLGMGYGVSCTSLLLALGVPPALASANVHIAKVFTTAASGASHWKLGNVDRYLVKRLLIPGVIGGVGGAYILTSLPADSIRPFVSVYLLAMGVLIIVKSFRPLREGHVRTGLVPLGFVGGLFDSIGGGGWGPIVTSTLMARGNGARRAIGSVNFTEFFVAIAQSATFIVTIGLTNWWMTLGLLIGGVIAAPLAAYTCNRMPTRRLMTAVGVVIVALSLRTIVQSSVFTALAEGLVRYL